MRGELETVQRDLEASRSIRGELALELASVTTDRNLAKEKLESEQLRATELIKQLEEKEQAIANLTTENQKLEEHLAEAAKNEIFLSEELNRFKYGIDPNKEEPTPPGEVEPESPAVNLLPEKTELSEGFHVSNAITPVELEPETDGLTRGELMEYIIQNYPGATIKPQNITDAINRGFKKLAEYERDYGFKYIDKIKGQHRFKILAKS